MRSFNPSTRPAAIFLLLFAMAFVWPVGARAQDSVYEHPLPAGFQETYSPGFAVVHRPEDERAAERLADYAREVRGRMKRDLGIGDPPLVTIRLAASEDDYRTLQPDGRERPEWSAGVAFPAKRIIVVYTPRGASRAGIRKDVRQILVHELAHVYLHDALGEADIPHWLQEGYARLAAGEGQITLAWELTWGWLLGRPDPAGRADPPLPVVGRARATRLRGVCELRRLPDRTVRPDRLPDVSWRGCARGSRWTGRWNG